MLISQRLVKCLVMRRINAKNMNDIFQSAIESHKSGRLREAEQLYKSVLAEEPKHSHANHNLGVLLVSVGYLSNALPYLRVALDQDPTVHQFWLSYIDALIKLGRVEMASEAICDGRQAGVPDESLSALTLARLGLVRRYIARKT